MLEIIADLYADRNDQEEEAKIEAGREWRLTGAVVSLSKGRENPQSIYKTRSQSKSEYTFQRTEMNRTCSLTTV